MSGYTMELACCEMVMLDTIAEPEARQRDVANVYAMSIVSSEARTVNWAKVHNAIANRWSHSAVERIKKQAWKIIETHRKGGES